MEAEPLGVFFRSLGESSAKCGKNWLKLKLKTYKRFWKKWAKGGSAAVSWNPKAAIVDHHCLGEIRKKEEKSSRNSFKMLSNI